MLLNLTNHPSEKWSREQSNAAAERWGSVRDYPFPVVSAQFDEKEIAALAQTVLADACKLHPDAVLCQGEMSLCFALVRLFQKNHIPVVAATSQREVAEKALPDGTTRKEAVFRFVRFREYSQL